MAAKVVDVCVIGAGPAGSVAARELARAGARVVMLSPSGSADLPLVGETVPVETQAVLRKLGMEHQQSLDGHLPSTGNISRWGSDTVQFRETILDCHGSGWHIDRPKFNRDLVAEASRSGVQVIPARFKASRRSRQSAWNIALLGDQHAANLRANFVVDCSGRASRLARATGAGRRVYDKLVAIWGMLESRAPAVPSDPGNSSTYIESAPDGWWYTAEIPGGRRVVAYFSDGDLVDRRELQRGTALLDRLTESTRVCDHIDCSGLRLAASPACVPSMSARLERVCGPGWIAAGDAAHCFDPLSSQGILAAIVGGNNAAAVIVATQSDSRQAMLDYQARLDGQFESYLAERSAYYRMEERWTGNLFWRRRHQAVTS